MVVICEYLNNMRLNFLISRDKYSVMPTWLIQAQSQISADKLQINHKENRDKGGGVHTTFYIQHTSDKDTNINWQGVQDNKDK